MTERVWNDDVEDLHTYIIELEEKLDGFDRLKEESKIFYQNLDQLIKTIIEEIPGTPTTTESSFDLALRLLTTSNKTKDDRIVRECKKSGEPYIVFRAKDDLAPGTLQFYMMRAVEEKCPAEFVEQLKPRFTEFMKWRGDHPYRTRMPD